MKAAAARATVLPPPAPPANPIDDYAAEVVAGRIPAGKYHRLACARHQRDRARERTAEFPYWFDLAHADRFFRFAERLRHYKGKWAGQLITLTPIQKFRLGCVFGWRARSSTGQEVRRFRTSYNELPRKQGKSLEAAIVGIYVTFFEGEQGAEGYCLHPKTRILMADLSWKEIDDVTPGDEILSMEEEIRGASKHRRMLPARVIAKLEHERPAIRIRFTDDTEVVCSRDHRWLSRSPRAGNTKWREAREMKPGYRIVDLGAPWETGRSWDAGYLAGLFDGEGYLFHGPRRGFQIGFSQKPGPVLEDCLATLTRAGFRPSEPRPHAGNTHEFKIRGLHQCLRFLGSIRPVRLLANAPKLWNHKKGPSSVRTIASLTPIGFERLIDIETTSRTFIAEGLISHNCIATKRDQAKIVFNDAKQLVQRSGLKNRIVVLNANLHKIASSSKFEPLGADSDSTDGLNPNLIIVDEFHAHKDRGLIDVMETATGAREQPLNFQITTAGDDPVSPCGDQHDYSCKILDQVLVDETFFAIICHADVAAMGHAKVDDDWLAESTWRKANPHYGISINPDDLRALATKARNMPSAAATFKQKRLNIWVNANAPWLSVDGWRTGQSTWPIRELEGLACWGGIDLSSKIDLTAIVLIFPPAGKRLAWRQILWAFTPDETLDERAHRDRAPYRIWMADPRTRLLTSPGKKINYAQILELLEQLKAKYAIQAIGFDPHNAENLQHDLVDKAKFGANQVVEIAQTYIGMSQAAKDFEADVLDGKVDAGGDPLMSWAVSNAVVQRDGKDNIYPVKKRSRGRIDPVTASVIARAVHARIGAPPPEKKYQMIVVGGGSGGRT